MAFLEGIAGYVERKGSKKRRHKTESDRFGFNRFTYSLSPGGDG